MSGISTFRTHCLNTRPKSKIETEHTFVKQRYHKHLITRTRVVSTFERLMEEQFVFGC